MGNARGQFTQGDQPRAVGQFVLVASLLTFTQFTLGHVARHQRVVALAARAAMGQQHQRHGKRRSALPGYQPRLGVPDPALLGALPAFAVQPLLQGRVQQGLQQRQRIDVLQPQRPARRSIEVTQAPVTVGKQHKVGIGLHHFGQPSTVFLGLDPHADVPRDADVLYHCTGVGLANGAAGDLEPQVPTVPMTHPAGHGLVAVLLQGLGGLRERLLAVLLMEQRLHRHPAQLLGPIPKQTVGGRRSIQKAAIGAVSGNQVGGVLGNQPIQAPRLAGLTFSQALGCGITAARQHLIGAGGDESPEQDAPGHRCFDITDGPRLAQAGGDQRREIAR
ncbi:hypothetical protein D3C77_415170 [compost metagenome]